MIVVSYVFEVHPFRIGPYSRVNMALDVGQDGATLTGLPELSVNPFWGSLGSNSDCAVGVVALDDSQAIPP